MLTTNDQNFIRGPPGRPRILSEDVLVGWRPFREAGRPRPSGSLWSAESHVRGRPSQPIFLFEDALVSRESCRRMFWSVKLGLGIRPVRLKTIPNRNNRKLNSWLFPKPNRTEVTYKLTKKPNRSFSVYSILFLETESIKILYYNA